jgi:hypothetical protein
MSPNQPGVPHQSFVDLPYNHCLHNWSRVFKLMEASYHS